MIGEALCGAWVALLASRLPAPPAPAPTPAPAEPAPAPAQQSKPRPASAPPSPWYWDGERTRPFVAGRVGLGASAFAELDLGYGKPFWLWAGFQGWAMATTEAAMASAGFKLGLPIFELSGGYRFVVPFERGPLLHQPSYDSAALERSADDAQPYVAYDLDALGFIPLPHVVLLPQVGFHYIGEQSRDLYEEEQRVIMGSPWLWYVKLAAVVTWGEGRRYGLGPLVEQFWNSRAQAVTRLGPSFSARFTPHLDALVVASFPVRGSDTLSLYDGLGGSLSLRYRWASGERKPAFP